MIASATTLPDLTFLDTDDARSALVAFVLSSRFAAIVCTTIAVAIAAAAANSLMRRDTARHGPALRRLARKVGLAAADRRLVTRVATRAGVSCPVAMLVSRGCFDASVARAGVSGEDAAGMARVRRFVFGTARA